MGKKIGKRKEYPDLIKNLIGMCIAASIGIASCCIFTAIFSYILSKSQQISSNLGLYLIISAGIGAFFCGVISAKKCKLKGIISGAVSALPYSLIITVILLFTGGGQLIDKTGFIYLTVIILSILGGIMGANTKR